VNHTDLVFGGGRYGTLCVQYILKQNRQCIVIDRDRDCAAGRMSGTPDVDGRLPPDGILYRFIEGSIPEALLVIEHIRPAIYFPPRHCTLQQLLPGSGTE
jgi:anaerobic glycerol-3-phosphate dehydrogenase